MQQYRDIYLLINYSTCFGRPSHPSSVHKTVVAAPGTDRTVWGASFLKRDQIRSLLTVASRWIVSTCMQDLGGGGELLTAVMAFFDFMY